MLRLENVRSGYGDVDILKGVSLEIQDSEIVTIVGANAAGKSTMINTISGILPLTGGKIFWNDEPIPRTPWDIVDHGIVQVPEGRRLFPFMSVKENIQLGAYSTSARENIHKNLDMVYSLFPILVQREKQMAVSLSGGEQQMCAIARGLMSQPKLLMLDEPSLGLAPIVVKQIFSIVSEINKQGMSILLVEQNVVQSLKIANRGYIFEQGQCVLEGKPEDILANEKLKTAYLGM